MAIFSTIKYIFPREVKNIEGKKWHTPQGNEKAQSKEEKFFAYFMAIFSTINKYAPGGMKNVQWDV